MHPTLVKHAVDTEVDAKEWALGWVVGDGIGFGVIPKSHQRGTLMGTSVNDGIQPELCSLSLTMLWRPFYRSFGVIVLYNNPFSGWYMDVTLPFGVTNIFTALADATTGPLPFHRQIRVTRLCSSCGIVLLGVPVSSKNIEGPATSLPFLTRTFLLYLNSGYSNISCTVMSKESVLMQGPLVAYLTLILNCNENSCFST